MWVRDRFVDQYVVDTSGLIREQQIAACRSVLQFVAADVDHFQCDVPWGERESWPREVVQAAAILAPLTEGTPSKKEYKHTGWVREFSDVTWQAFVVFAPYAYSADAWTVDMKSLAEIEDEGTSLVVRVPPAKLRQLEQAIPNADIVPLGEWRKRKKQNPNRSTGG